MRTEIRFLLVVLGVVASAPAGGQHPSPPGSERGAAPPLVAAAQLPAEEAGPPAFAGAEAPPLDALLALARESSPGLAVARARVRAASERVAPAGALANPMVEARLANMSLTDWMVGEDESSMLEVGVRQALPFRGKREARREVARAEAEALAAELAAAERQVEKEVQRLYARLYALDRERRALDEAHELIELMAATVAARYGSGEGEQEAVLKVHLALSQHDDRRLVVAGERESVAAELRRWLDLPAGTPVGEVVSLPPVEPLPDDLAGDHSSDHPSELAALAAESAPEVAVGRAMAVAAERLVASERLELKPDFSVGAGLGYRGSLDPAVTLSVGVELPFWRRQRQEPLIRAAEQELVAAREREREIRGMARAEAERLLASWRRVEGQLRLSEQAILPQTGATFDAARTSYLNARGDFSMVVDDYNLWLDARVAHAALEAERLAIRAEIAALVVPLARSPQSPRSAAAGAQP